MTSYNFELERGLPKEETGRVHIDIQEYFVENEILQECYKNIKFL